jgi:hypothetical protein
VNNGGEQMYVDGICHLAEYPLCQNNPKANFSDIYNTYTSRRTAEMNRDFLDKLNQQT